MNEFKQGTKVRVISIDAEDEMFGLKVGDTGTVLGTFANVIKIIWDRNHPQINNNRSGCFPEQIEIVEETE